MRTLTSAAAASLALALGTLAAAPSVAHPLDPVGIDRLVDAQAEDSGAASPRSIGYDRAQRVLTQRPPSAALRLAQADAAGALAPAAPPTAASPPASPQPATAAPPASPRPAAVDPATLPAQDLVLETRSGRHDFTVEIADDPMERQVGLMFREQMSRNHGMLFDFASEGERSFWMKNTILPLDLVFARADGTVISIRHGVPFSLDGIASDGPARFVLELNAGVAGEIGLAPGDRLVHRRVVR